MSKKLFLLVSLLCVLGVLSSNVLADPNLLVRYSFDDQQATDETGNGNNGTISTTGVSSYADPDPARGYIMSFNGGYISIPAPVFTNITTAATITLWQNGASTLPLNCVGFSGDAGVSGRIFNTNLPWGNGSVIWDAGHLGTGDGTATYDRLSKAATADQYKEKWNHWAFSKNVATGEMKVYLNGQLFSSITGKTKPITGCTRFNIGASTTGGNPYQGSIDDFRIYNKIFTQKELLEVAELHSAKQQAPDGLTNLSVTQTLSWIAAFSETRSFQVYWGTNSDNVKNSTPYNKIGDTSMENVGTNITSFTHTFAPATTYYWRVDVVGSDNTYADEAIHTFSTGLANSYNFLPADAATGLAVNKVVLSWTAGSLPVTGYNVYLGTASSALVKVSSAQTATSYTPAGLLANKTYFWKIEDLSSPSVNSATISFSTIAAVDPNLVGWWKFDQVGATNAVDSSGNGHNGTFLGTAAIVADGSDAALSLDGISANYVRVIGYKAVQGQAARSTSAWIKTTAGGAVLSWGTNSAGNKWHMRIESGVVRTGLTNGYIKGKIKVNDSQWHHIASAIQNDGSPNSNEIVTYVDGVKDTNEIASVAMNTTSTYDVNIGNWLPDQDYYSGLIKDARIYNKAITQKEALEMAGNNYTQAQSPDGTTGLPLQVTFSWVAAFSESRTFKLYYGTDPGLVGATVQTVTNASSYTATLASNTTYYWRVDTVVGSNTYQDAKIHTFTVAPASSYNFSPVNGATGLTPDKTSLSWSAGSVVVTGYNVYLGTNQSWVTAGSNGTKLTATPQTDTSFKPTNLLENTIYFWRIEDVRTPIVTSTVMTFTTGKLIDPALVGWWNFKSVTGTTVPDDSGNSHVGTLTGAGAAVIEDPERGLVLSLHGGGEYVVVTGYKGILGANPRTTMAWIKTSTTGTTPRGIIAWGANSTNQRWDMVLYNNNLRQMIYNSNRTATPIINDGNWHHVASVLKGGTDTNLNTVTLYVDGIKAVASGDSATVNTVSSKDLRIGDADAVSGTGRNFVGQLSDVRLYNRALTDAEISALATLPNVIVVDNMEDYNDVTKPINGVGGWRDNIFNHDVGGDASIGLSGYTNKGNQSLQFYYNNWDGDHWKYFCSEVVKIFSTPQDWSYNTSKVKILTIPVMGLAANFPDKVYAALEDDAQKSYTVYYKKNGVIDTSICTSVTWVKWELNLDEFKNSGVNLARIKKLFLGVGDRYSEIGPNETLEGTIYIDEITLNPPHCNPVEKPTVGDLTNDCIVNFKDAKLMAANWLVSDVTVSPQTIPADGNLVAQYNFNNSDATDSSGYGHDCNTIGNVTYITDSNPQRGMVASFDGSVGNYLNTGGGPGGWATFRTSMTYCAWIKVDQFTVNMQCLIGTTGAYRISRNGTTNQMRLWNDSPGAGTLAGVTAVNDNLWHHVCGVVSYDATSNSTTYTLYLDGKIENSIKRTGKMAVLSGDVSIGTDDPAYPGREWKGLVDDVRFYNRALSHGEVLTLAGITQSIIIPVDAAANLVKKNVSGQEIIDYRDFSVLAKNWLMLNLWP